MEIQINFDNLQIETLNMNLEKNSEKPATGKQLWKLQNQVLRNLRIIDTLKKACTTYHIEDKQYHEITEWEDIMEDMTKLSFPISLEKASNLIKQLVNIEKDSLNYHKRFIEKKLTRKKESS